MFTLKWQNITFITNKVCGFGSLFYFETFRKTVLIAVETFKIKHELIIYLIDIS